MWHQKTYSNTYIYFFAPNLKIEIFKISMSNSKTKHNNFCFLPIIPFLHKLLQLLSPYATFQNRRSVLSISQPFVWTVMLKSLPSHGHHLKKSKNIPIPGYFWPFFHVFPRQFCPHFYFYFPYIPHSLVSRTVSTSALPPATQAPSFLHGQQ